MGDRGLAAKSAAIIGKEIGGLKVTSNFEQSAALEHEYWQREV